MQNLYHTKHTVIISSIVIIALGFYSKTAQAQQDRMRTKTAKQHNTLIIKSHHNTASNTTHTLSQNHNQLPIKQDLANLAQILGDGVEIPPAPTHITKPCEDQHHEHLPWLDRTYLKLSQTLCDQIMRFDQFFGDANYEDDYPTSFFRVRNSVIWENEEETALRFRPRVRAKIRLPNMEDRLNLIISDDSEDENTLSTANEIVPEDSDSENKVSTALRWVAKKSQDFEINFDIGARIDQGLNFFIRSRYRKTVPLDHNDLFRFKQEFFWRDQEGFGERTQVDYEKSLNQSFLARWTLAGTFSEESNGIDWTQRFTLFHQINPIKAISYNFGANGETRPYNILSNYGISIRYRKNIYSHWLYAELEPEINWPRAQNREPTPQLTFRIEIQLGR